MSAGQTVCFLATELDFQTFRETFPGILSSAIVVACSPEVHYLCEKYHVSYVLMTDYYSEKMLIQEGIQNFSKVEEFCLLVEKVLRDEFAQLLKQGSTKNIYSPFEEFYFYKRFFDFILHRGSVAQTIVKRLSPKKVYIPRVESLNSRSDAELFITGDGIYFFIKNVCEKLNIECVEVKKTVNIFLLNLRLHKFISNLKAKLKFYFIEFGVIKDFLKNFLKNRSAEAQKNSTTRSLIVDENHFSFFPMLTNILNNEFHLKLVSELQLLELLRLKDYLFIFISLRKYRKNLKEVLKKIFKSNEYQALTNILSVSENSDKDTINFSQSVYPLTKSFIQTHLLNGLKRFLYFEKSLDGAVKNKKIAGVLLGAGNTSLGRAAVLNNIPTFHFQYGGGYGYINSPMLEFLVYFGAQYTVVGGSGVKSWYDLWPKIYPNRQLTQRAESLPLGLPLLQRFFEKRKQSFNKKNNSEKSEKTKALKVLYGVASINGDGRHLSYSTLSDLDFWQLNRKVASLVGQYPESSLTLKMPPSGGVRQLGGKNPIKEWVHDKGIQNCQVISSGSFVDLMFDADIILMDIPSTLILQSVTTSAKIIVLADPTWVQITPHARECLEKRVFLCESIDIFLEKLKSFLEKPESVFTAAPVNDEFLYSFGMTNFSERDIASALEKRFLR